MLLEQAYKNLVKRLQKVKDVMDAETEDHFNRGMIHSGQAAEQRSEHKWVFTRRKDALDSAFCAINNRNTPTEIKAMGEGHRHIWHAMLDLLKETDTIASPIDMTPREFFEATGRWPHGDYCPLRVDVLDIVRCHGRSHIEWATEVVPAQRLEGVKRRLEKYGFIGKVK